MIIVSNTSPLNYLLLVNAVDVLPTIYGQIHVPDAVLAELSSADSPEIVRHWVQSPPAWLLVQNPSRLHLGPPLHAGEAHAISLAVELKAARLIMDDNAGRAAAGSLDVPLIGTIGILDLAAEKGLINLPSILNQLAQTNFRIAQRILDEILKRNAAR